MNDSQNSFNGVTTGSYTDNTLKMSCRRKAVKSISIKNTDGANGLFYKFIGYFDKNEEMSENLKVVESSPLVAGAIYTYMINQDQYDHINVLIKEAVSATRATWLVHFNFR